MRPWCLTDLSIELPHEILPLGQGLSTTTVRRRYDPQPRGRLLDWLNAQGLQDSPAITFLSDGGETARELPIGLHPQAEHLLDWFHLTMRVTTMSRLAQGVRAEDYLELGADLEEMLEHLKWNLWHGKVDRAFEIVDELVYALDVEDANPEHRKLLKAVQAFEVYLTNNRAFVPNYGARYREENHLDCARGIGCQPGGKQAFREETADAGDASGRPSSAANPH